MRINGCTKPNAPTDPDMGQNFAPEIECPDRLVTHSAYGRRVSMDCNSSCPYHKDNKKRKEREIKDEDEVYCLLSPCTHMCKTLLEGKCQHLSIDEIKELLDKSDWDDLDKGEVLTPYIIRELPRRKNEGN